MILTANQKQVLAAVVVTTRLGRFYRAADAGQRVTLASLYRKGLCTRAAWRGADGDVDAAYEYQATGEVLAVLAAIHQERNPS